MATHDPRAWDKTFTIDPGKEFCIRTNVENMAVPGSDHKDPLPVMMGVYRGSWMEGCKIYRKFAITAPWTSEGKVSQRTGMPKALKDIGLWMLVGNYIGPQGVGLIEPTSHIETITETWPDHGNNFRTATLPGIQGSIWKAEDGTLGIFLANYLEKNNTIEFTIDPTRYGLNAASAGYTTTQIQPEGNHVGGGVLSRTEALGPWEIRILEIRAN